MGKVETRCHGCNAGPIHPWNRSCRCSFLRNGHTVCRDCAVAYDLIVDGYTKISHPNDWITKEVIAAVVTMQQRAASVAW